MKATAEQAELLHTFSHDLRNRLIGLQQVLDRLKEPGDEAERAELSLYGEQQFFKALREVEKLMDAFQLERGTLALDRQPTALDLLVQERVELLRFRTERKQQVVELDLQASVILPIDARVIGDLIDALLTNASKFSPAGSTIQVQLRADEDEATLHVCDHGVGLRPADLEEVFVRFAWLESRPTGNESQGRGTLARALHWASAHGGSLAAKSKGEGAGCTFTLQLPLC